MTQAENHQEIYKFSSLDDRYREASFTSRLTSGSLLYTLSNPISGSSRVVINEEESKKTTNADEIKTVFLDRLSLSGNWSGYLWAREINPWLNKRLPIVGSTVCGSVVDFVEDYTAIVLVEHHNFSLRFFLNRDHLLPINQKSDIRETIFRGDIVAGKVRPPDVENLRLNLDLNSWVNEKRRVWSASDKNSEFEHPKSLIENSETRKSNWFSAMNGKTVLLIEDEYLLCQALSERLAEFGANILISSGAEDKGMLDSVYRNLMKKPDIIIVDFQLEIDDLEEKELFSSIEAYLERFPKAHCSIMSGNFQKAQNFAANKGYGYIAKPANPSEIFDWIANPKSAELSDEALAERKSHGLFTVESTTIRVIQKTNELLNELCTRHNMLGAAWFVELTPGRFELRSSSKFFVDNLSKDLVDQLQNSVIGNIHAPEEVKWGRLPNNDPFSKNSPLNELPKEMKVHFLVVPITVNDGPSRFIIFFKNGSIDIDTRKSIALRKDHFSLLIETINQSDAMDEISAFAQAGRMAIGTLHEIRTQLATTMALLDSSRASDEKVTMFGILTKKIQSLSMGQLENFVPNRTESINLAERISEICSPLHRYMRDTYKGSSVELIVNTKDVEGLVLAINPVPLERAMINLIDNGAAFVQVSPIRKIWVTASRTNADINRPIEIVVKDTGPGLTVIDYHQLFLPRKTGRPDKSTGLGLYLSRVLLESIGASLTIQREPRWGGASFSICLPERIGANT